MMRVAGALLFSVLERVKHQHATQVYNFTSAFCSLTQSPHASAAHSLREYSCIFCILNYELPLLS
jgi:hypothetical protein